MLVRILATLAILMLSACKSTIKPTKIEAEKPLDTNHGVVGVQVINNTDQLAQLHSGWTEVIVVRIDNFKEKKQQAIDKAREKSKRKVVLNKDKVKWEPDFYSLSPAAKGVINSQVFIGSMPEGTYKISSLYSYYNSGDYSSWLTMPVDTAAGIFEVKKSKLTNLGTVVFQPLLNIKQASFWDSHSSQKAYVTRVKAHTNLDDYILSSYPKLAASVDLKEVLGWNDDELTEFRHSLSQLSRKNAYGDTAIPLTKYGKGIIAARFGQLRWQDHQDQWHQIDLDTNSQLAAVLELENHILVGGERGQLFVAKDLSSPFKSISKISPQEAIIWFGKNQQHNFAMTQSVNQYKVYQFSTLNDEWTLLRSFKRKGFSWLVLNGDLFPFMTTTGQLAIINDDKRYQYNSDTDIWREQKNDRIKKLTQLSNGTLLAIGVSQWDGTGDQLISQDSGESWVSVYRYLYHKDTIADHSLPVVLNDGTVVTLGRKTKRRKVRDQNNKLKYVQSDLKIMTTPITKANKRKSWQHHGLVKENCQTLLPEISTANAIHFLCDRGDIIFTKDLGTTWEHVINIDIEQMQLTFEKMVATIKADQAQKREQQAQDKSSATKSL